ncbi:MAG: lycopene beta-cyclase CrtY [Pseudomonadales bacterium]
MGGNHTWSFFPTDLSPAQLDWIDPLILHRWQSYEVRFPALSRRLGTGYRSTNSEFFHMFMMGALGDCVRLDAPIEEVDVTSVGLRGGETLHGRCIIDGRGPVPSRHLMLGFQKFTGQVLQLETEHGLEGPIIMDATVPQNGDYRFLYTLPVGPRELLVEDTRYSNTPDLDFEADFTAIADYAVKQGWSVAAAIKEEQGALPITLGGDIDAFFSDANGIPRIGLRAALFHATTGYSFAEAVRTADFLAESELGNTADVFQLLSDRAKRHWSRQAYWRLLNRMLFIAAVPDQRWFVMQRFYGLHQSLIERFYAGQPTLSDKLRILTGKPPVAILRALRCLPQSSAAAHTIEVVN